MNGKKILTIVVGAVVFYLVTFILGMVTGPLIHTGVLEEAYMATSEFWRPELSAIPPDMAALMPLWIQNGLISALVFSTMFSLLRPGLSGPGWKQGLNFGFLGATFAAMFCLGWFGIFDLPAKIWTWWAVEGYIYWIPGGIALGFVAEKLAPKEEGA